LSETTNNEKILIGVIEVNEAKRLKEKLSSRGVSIDLIHDDETCKKSYQSKVEVWVNSDSMETVQKMIHEENMHMIMSEGVDVNPDQLNQVFDSEAETAVCPACGTSFSTKLTECPECGLVFFNE